MNSTTLLALWVDRERADRLGTPRELPDVLAPRDGGDRRGWSDGRWRAFFDRSPQRTKRRSSADHRHRRKFAV